MVAGRDPARWKTWVLLRIHQYNWDLGPNFPAGRRPAPIVVDDAAATYPLDMDSRIAASRTPVASFGGGWGASFRESVALPADGQEALLGAPVASGVNGAAYLYTDSAGSWPTVPAATFTGNLGQSLGPAVALSASGQVALVGADTGSPAELFVYTSPARSPCACRRLLTDLDRGSSHPGMAEGRPTDVHCTRTEPAGRWRGRKP